MSESCLTSSLSTTLCNWTLDFPTSRQQTVWIGRLASTKYFEIHVPYQCASGSLKPLRGGNRNYLDCPHDNLAPHTWGPGSEVDGEIQLEYHYYCITGQHYIAASLLTMGQLLTSACKTPQHHFNSPTPPPVKAQMPVISPTPALLTQLADQNEFY